MTVIALGVAKMHQNVYCRPGLYSPCISILTFHLLHSPASEGPDRMYRLQGFVQGFVGLELQAQHRNSICHFFIGPAPRGLCWNRRDLRYTFRVRLGVIIGSMLNPLPT